MKEDWIFFSLCVLSCYRDYDDSPGNPPSPLRRGKWPPPLRWGLAEAMDAMTGRGFFVICLDWNFYFINGNFCKKMEIIY